MTSEIRTEAPSASTPVTRKRLTRRPFQVVVLALVTGGLYVPVWWLGVLREEHAHRTLREPEPDRSSGSLWHRIKLIVSAVAVALFFMALWFFFAVQAVVDDQTSPLVSAAWLFILFGVGGGVISLSQTDKRLRSLEEAATGRQPVGSVRRIGLRTAAVLTWPISWPIIVVNGVYAVERRLSVLPQSPEALSPEPACGDQVFAWKAWTRWRGHRQLLVRIIRACLWAAGKNGETECLIKVSALGDAERFRLPREFKEDATPEALRRFETILINVSGEHVRVRVRLKSGRVRRRSPYDAGVVLRVHGRPGTSREQVLRARDEVASAVQRGSGRFSRTAPTGDPAAESLGRALASAHLETERIIGIGAVALFGAASFLGNFAAAWAAAEPPGNWILVTQFLPAGIAAAASFAFFLRLLPSVTLAETAAQERIRRLSAEAAMAALGALMGVALSFLPGG